MSQSSIPICNIRYCHRPPASWILAGFSLLEKDGLLKLGKVTCYDKFLSDGLYQHNNIIEVSVDNKLIVFDYENGYQSFLSSELFDNQMDNVTALFKSNCNPQKYIGLRNQSKIHPFVAGTFTATCPDNPYDKIFADNYGFSRDGIVKFMYSVKHHKEYIRINDYRNTENLNHFDSYNLLFWTRLNEEVVTVQDIKNSYPFLDDEGAEKLSVECSAMLRDINLKRIEICSTLKKEYDDRLIGGIADGDYARRNCPELITTDERIATRSRYLETMHSNIIGVISSGHQYCIGARFGELISSGRAIISDPFRYVLPGDFSEGKNYLSFASSDELCEKAEFLLGNPSAVNEMETVNSQYYHNFFEPRKCVLDALKTALPEYEIFNK